MDFNKLEYYTSQPRIDRFLIACGNSKSKAQRLYRINLRVSQSFYPLLNLFEIFIRNSLNYQISAHFTNPNWIMTEKNGFMSDPSLNPSRYFLKKSVQKAENLIRRKRGVVTSGKVIAEQSFGFWTSLFDPHHYRLIGGSVIHSFGNKPTDINRRALSIKLTEIRQFRNRIYHNEPICFSGNSIDFTDARQIKNDFYEMLEWMDNDLKLYAEYFDNVESKIIPGENL